MIFLILMSDDASSPPHPQILPCYSTSALLSVFILVYHRVPFFPTASNLSFFEFFKIFPRYYWIVESAATCHLPMILPSETISKASLTMFHLWKYFLSIKENFRPKINTNAGNKVVLIDHEYTIEIQFIKENHCSDLFDL